MTRYLPLLFAILLTAACVQAQQTVGLFKNDSLAVNGYTLFSNNKTTYLIDNCGLVVNTWTSDYTTQSGLYLLENGNLLRSCVLPGSFNVGGQGGRIELQSWEGELLWAYNYASDNYHQHHDICPLPNGNVLVLAWERRTFEEAIQAGRRPELITAGEIWPESIVELEMAGSDQANVVWEWHLWDHLVQDFDPNLANFGIVSEHPELIDINFTGPNLNGVGGTSKSWIHANGLDYHPGLDQIAICSRSFSEIWVIDHSTTTAEAAGHSGGNSGKGGDLLYRWGNPATYQRGTVADQQLWAPHHVTWVPPGYPNAGMFMIFNNGAGRPDGNYSTVEYWPPPVDSLGNYSIQDGLPFAPAAADWRYSAPGFYSQFMSGAQAMPNGNIFICEGVEGRFFEISPDSQLVWEYINPCGLLGPVSQGQTVFGAVFRALKYPEGYPAFIGRDLSPGAPVELNPLPYDCVIYPAEPPVAAAEPAPVMALVSLKNSLVERMLFIENRTEAELQLEIWSAVGTMLGRASGEGPLLEVEVSDLPAGVYFIRWLDLKGRRSGAKRFVKPE